MTSLVDIQLADYGSKTPDKRQICGWVEMVFFTLRRPPKALTIRIVNEEEMKGLNRRYCGKDQSTNVLSFPFNPLPDSYVDLLGDVVVCASVVAREALEQDKLLIGHWAHMIVHGMLHLFGYSHESDRQAEVMERIEWVVLERLGFSDPYQEKRVSSDQKHAKA